LRGGCGGGGGCGEGGDGGVRRGVTRRYIRSRMKSGRAGHIPARLGFCEGFRTPAVTNGSTRTAAGVRKPPRDETVGRGTYWAVPRAQLWGFGGGQATAAVGGAVG